MAQTVFRGNLSVGSFPFISGFGGRSVVIPQLDENYLPKNLNNTSDPDRDRGIPQVAYLHNVLPVGQGYKSVAYTKVTVAPNVAINNFTVSKIVKDSTGNKAIIGLTATGGVYILSAITTIWTQIVVPGWAGVGTVTFANVSGNAYICFPGIGIYKISITTASLITPTLLGITPSAMLGITDSNNYLICYDTSTIYWSSASNPLDFVPSLITGAGSAVPNDLDGLIVFVTSMNNGFAVYTTVTIILSTFSGNTRFPWIFRGASFGGGITSSDQVTSDANLGFHYAWTSAGMLKVSNAGCESVMPEVSDFLGGRIFEDFNTTTNTFTVQYLTKQLGVQLNYIGTRYLVISYGILDEAYTHAIVYDTSFLRWGKLRIPHVQAFEVSLDITGGSLPYTGLAGTVYATYLGRQFTTWTTVGNSAAKPKQNIGFLQSDGTIQLVDFAFGNTGSDAVLVLGKFQLNRNNLCTLEQFEVEGIDAASNNFNVVVLSTTDGYNYLPNIVPSPMITLGNLRKYNMRVSGVNHSVVMKGAFHVTSVLLSFHNSGRR